jgi:hypothetical protein
MSAGRKPGAPESPDSADTPPPQGVITGCQPDYSDFKELWRLPPVAFWRLSAAPENRRRERQV